MSASAEQRSAAAEPPPSLPAPGHAGLRRTLTLTNAVLYGLGVTIGAGIYVLIGAAAARAGMHAPVAFVIAAVLMGLTATSFAELAGRMPVAAGEADRFFAVGGVAQDFDITDVGQQTAQTGANHRVVVSD